MPENRDARTINCPTCGGPLTGSETRCPFCGATVERTMPEQAAPSINIGVQPAAGYRTRRRGCISPLIVVLAAILVAGGLLFFLLQPRSAGNLLVGISRTVQYAAMPVATDRQGPADVLVLTYDSTSEQRYISYIDGADGALRWDSPPVSLSVYHEGIVVRSDTVYVADGATLMALSAADGQLSWQATLSDSVMNICQGCLRVVGSMVVVLSQDGVLQAYEAQGGRPAWSVRLNETPRDLWEVGGLVAVVDYEQANDVYSVALQLRDPATGEVVRALPGVCQEGYYRNNLPVYNANILVDPAGDAVYFLYGLLPGCAQRWDVESGQLAWQVRAEDHYFDRFTAPPMIAGDHIYGSYNGRIIAIDVETGALSLLADEQDYELTLQGERSGTLVALARRQRGSTRYELWGMAADGGQVRWKYIPQDQQPIEESGGRAADEGFAWCLTRDGLGLLHLIAEPPTLLTGALDLQDGQETILVTSGLDDDYWAGLVCSGNTAWLTIHKLYTIDLESGRVLRRWP